MCQKCGDTEHKEELILPGRRKVILGAAAGMAAIPMLGGVASAAAAPAGQPGRSPAGPGPYSVKAYGNASPAAEFRPLRVKRRALRPNDVLIDIHYCAVCHSDIHIARQEWPAPYPATRYPCVPGHEIIGRVTAVGSAVSRFQVGDFAGSGAMIDSCGVCEHCQAGLEQYCQNGWTLNFNSVDKTSGEPNYGGFSEQIVVPERFAVRIPPGMDMAKAAPLMCAGITTFSPMEHWRLGAGQRVGIIGMGGLGHMAVKLAVARKAETVVFTTTPGKLDDAHRMGAADAVLWNDVAALTAWASHFDLLISTIPVPLPLQPLTNMLRLDGTLVIVGAREPLQNVTGSGLWLQRRTVSGSLMGGMAETQMFVDYCLRHHIEAEVEVIKPDQIDEAFTRIKHKDVRYRFVVDLRHGRQA